ncbi:MAG: hypothetical protein M1118_06815 [Chloroflexi bacterium]|nr:hypothetical protein [Chloroflexota bacterium]
MKLAKERAGLMGVWRVRYRDPVTGRMWDGGTYRNVICFNGKALIAAWLNGENPALGPIYGAVGTGTAAPASTDAQLQAEIARVALASSSRNTSVNNSVVLFDFFFTTGQANAMSSAANAGALLSHVAISETKTSSVTMTLEFSIQIG